MRLSLLSISAVWQPNAPWYVCASSMTIYLRTFRRNTLWNAQNDISTKKSIQKNKITPDDEIQPWTKKQGNYIISTWHLISGIDHFSSRPIIYWNPRNNTILHSGIYTQCLNKNIGKTKEIICFYLRFDKILWNWPWHGKTDMCNISGLVINWEGGK
jgi:hypothetical protein